MLSTLPSLRILVWYDRSKVLLWSRWEESRRSLVEPLAMIKENAAGQVLKDQINMRVNTP